MTEKDYVTKDLCDERSKHTLDAINNLDKQLEKHCSHIDMTFAEIFKRINERNSKDSYNQGVADTVKLQKTLSTKKLVAIIAAVSGIVTALIEGIVLIVLRK